MLDRKRRWSCWAILGLLSALPPAGAQTVGGNWTQVGPGPAYGGQVEGITNGEVTGAVNAVAPHPSNADVLYIGAVNGGVWRTSNATAASPTWVRLTDALGSLSILSLEFDATDASAQTLVAGSGRNSSFSSNGGTQIGMLRTTDGGSNWTVLAGGVLTGRQLFGVYARGATLVAATDNGVYRSTDTGTTFTLLSGGVSSGLPAGRTQDLARDPGTANRLYTALTSGSARGVFRSDDAGASWVRVSDTTIDAALAGAVSRAELVVGAAGQVFVAIVTSGRLSHVFRSADGSTAWASLGVPTTAEQNGTLIGAHPGGQGGTHLSMAADPTNSNIVYIAGDRQPYFGEAVSGSQQFFPNSSGANDYSGRSFRGDASQPETSRWTRLTHSGAANNSAPHADSRDMAFDAAGNLIESDDGGVYKRISPRLGSGAWVSLNGDLQVTEYHSVAYDAVSDRVIGGAQDTGTTEQRNTANRIFSSVSTADGGDVAVEDRASATSSTRYSSFQNLDGFMRRAVNAANTTTSTAFPALTVTGGPAFVAQFYTPLVTNEVSATRLLIAGNSGLYESSDRGDTLFQINTQVVNFGRGTPLEYGVPGNPDLVYFGSGNNLYLRTSTSGGAAAALVNTMPGTVSDVAIHRDIPTQLFALTSSTVQYSTNSGGTFAAITGNLVSGFSPGTLRSMIFAPGGDPALVVGSDRGVYIAYASSGYTAWSRLGNGLANSPVYELEYDRLDDVLVAGTLGRGAWRLSPVMLGDDLFRNGFE